MSQSAILTSNPAVRASRPAAVRFGRAGALYDLVVTVAFATPLTAIAMLDLQRGLHTASAGSNAEGGGELRHQGRHRRRTLLTPGVWLTL